MLSKDDFEAVVKRVPNHGTDRHAHMLYGLIRWLQPQSVVEVGAAHGFTTCWMAKAVQDNNAALGTDTRVTVIDDYSLYKDAYAMLWHNVGLCQVGEIIQVAVGNSREVEWPERVDFAYVDADHSFEGCKYDVEKAIAHGATCVCIHDTTSWWGPREYMDRFTAGWPEYSGEWTEVSVGFDQGFTVMMKRPDKEPVSFTQAQYPKGCI